VPDARPADPKAVASKPGDAKPGDAKPGDAKAGDAPPEPPISESERALLLDLRKRREELDARAADLTAREGVLAAAEARLAARMGELSGLQKRLESLEAARQAHDDANWQGLVKLYESMKPKDAATIFNDLDLPVLLPVLDRMKDRKAALVLAAMSPDRARMVTAELARMRARANDVPPPASAAGGAAATPPGKTAGGG
jgi:flagellar motility protein MotE (MotC chaperone)